MRWLSLLLVAAPCLALRQPWEYLEALTRFQDEFLNPVEVVRRGWSETLADDIVGRVDVTTTFEGQELNTEYLFGLFANIRAEQNTSILGFPISQAIQTLVVEPPVVFFSAVAQLAYPTLDKKEFPIQIDVITAWNDDLKMVSYDATLRRFPLFLETVAKHLGPVLAEEMGEEYDPNQTAVSALFSRKAALEICPTAMQYCTEENHQYPSYDACYRFLTEERSWGGALDGGLDTTWCRYIHRNMVPIRPNIHCAHIGPSGGDMCIDRDYVEVATAFPFSQTLVAPNATWDDRDMAGLSEASIKALGRVRLTVPMPTTVAFFSVPTFACFLVLYLLAKIIERFLENYAPQYKMLSTANKRNTVSYCLSLVATTVALGYQLQALPSLVHEYSTAGSEGSIITSILISALYLFELVYRESMRASLLTHHLCTLLAISSLYIALEHTYHPATIAIGTIWLFQATTEQSVFAGLIMYRLGCSSRKTRAVLRFAAIQSFAFKFFFALHLLFEHTRSLLQFMDAATDVYFSVIVYGIGSLLLLTQAWGSWAVWSIAKKLDKESPIALPLSRPGSHEEERPLLSSSGSTLVSGPGSETSDTDNDGPQHKKRIDAQV